MSHSIADPPTGRDAQSQGEGAPGAPPDFLDLLMAEQDSLQRFVSSLVGHDSHHVEDVVQETLLRTWQRADRLDWSRRPIRMWLFRVARNLVVDDWRKERAVCVGISAEEFANGAPVADHAALVADRSVAVAALRTLPAAQREAVAYTHLLDRPVRETSRLLEVPVGTVKSRTHHGLRALRGLADEQSDKSTKRCGRGC